MWPDIILTPKSDAWPLNTKHNFRRWHVKQMILLGRTNAAYVRFQVLTTASMMFRVVFWDILPCKIIVDQVVGTSVLLRTTQPSAKPVVTSRSHWYHPGLSTRPFQGLNCIDLTSSPDIPLSLFYLNQPPTAIGRFLAYRLSPRLAT
jgi:hypothetical protein